MTRKALALLALPLLAACGSTTATSTASTSPTTSAARAAAAPTAEAPPPKAPGLGKRDVTLAVKILKKECFGSAGCNVRYRMVATVDKAKMEPDATYSVIYDVTGLEDSQTGTLTLKADGTYEQDDFLTGQTRTTKVRLKAVVTDVEKLL